MNWYCIRCWRSGEARDVEEASIFHYGEVMNDIYRVPAGMFPLGPADFWIKVGGAECEGDIRIGTKEEQKKADRPSMLLLFDAD